MDKDTISLMTEEELTYIGIGLVVCLMILVTAVAVGVI